MGVYIGASWRIRQNDPCAAAMRPYIKLLLLLVTFVTAFVYTNIEHVNNGDKNAPVRALI